MKNISAITPRLGFGCNRPSRDAASATYPLSDKWDSVAITVLWRGQHHAMVRDPALVGTHKTKAKHVKFVYMKFQFPSLPPPQTNMHTNKHNLCVRCTYNSSGGGEALPTESPAQSNEYEFICRMQVAFSMLHEETHSGSLSPMMQTFAAEPPERLLQPQGKGIDPEASLLRRGARKREPSISLRFTWASLVLLEIHLSSTNFYMKTTYLPVHCGCGALRCV